MMQSVFNFAKSCFLKRSLRQQQIFAINDLGQWSLSTNAKGNISVNGADATDLVAMYGSPLLVVNRGRLIKDAQSIQDAVSQAGGDPRVVYSYKTNCIPGILRDIHGVGIGAEVVSPYELWLAERLGVPGEKIVYNGVDKTGESLERAVSLDILSINIDSLPEIDRVVSAAKRLNKKARVGVRLGFIPTAQFGLEVESGEAMAACRMIDRHSEWLELNMVHFCVATNVRDSATHRGFTGKALDFVKEIKLQTGRVIRYLNIGGGMGVPTSLSMSNAEYGLYRLFGCLPKPPDPGDFEDIDTFVGGIESLVRETSAGLNIQKPSIVVEPGRFVTSRSEFLLSTVLSIKEKRNGTKFAITDAGRLSLTFPCDFEYHSVFTVDQGRKREKALYTVMGRSCTSGDFMMKNLLLPRLREGDVLATMDAGAYFSSFSTNFAFPRPAIVMVCEESGVRVIHHAESFEHLIAMDAGFCESTDESCRKR